MQIQDKTDDEIVTITSDTAILFKIFNTSDSESNSESETSSIDTIILPNLYNNFEFPNLVHNIDWKAHRHNFIPLLG